MTDNPLVLQNFASDWDKSQLVSCCSLIKDGTHGTHERVENGIPLLSAKNITEEGSVHWDSSDSCISKDDYNLIHRRYQLEKNDLLLTVVGTLGRRALVKNDDSFTIQRSVAVLRTNESLLEPNYLYHFTGSAYFQKQLVLRSNSTAQAGLYLGELEQIEIAIPDIQEQKKIAEVLDTIDEAIATTTAHINKLKQAKAGLLHDLLTRGIDENGELRDPVEHPELFWDSPIGRIPKDWEVVPLSSVAKKITSGSRGWAQYYVRSGAMFIRIGNLTREHTDLQLENLIYVSPPAGTEGARTKVEEGDVLISITADLGIVGVIPKDFGKAFVNQHIALVRVDKEDVVPFWIGLMLSHENGQAQFRKANDSGAKAGLNLSAIASLLIAKPKHDEQTSIAEIVGKSDSAIKEKSVCLNKLKLLKKGLMSDLLTGRVRVNLDDPEDA